MSHNRENNMARCLFGAFFIAAGLAALTSAAWESSSSLQESASSSDKRLRMMQTEIVTGAALTLLRPAPRYNLSFSLN